MSKPTTSATTGQGQGILWRGHPWIGPAFVGATVAAVAIMLVLTWLELRFGIAFSFRVFSLPFLVLTYIVVFLFWLVYAIKLAVFRASNTYTLRQSSLEIKHGIVGRKTFTISAAGFSDLEVVQGVSGRILNMGDIMMETDSHRDMRMRKVRDPMRVSTMLREVMTTPMVRVAPGGPVVEEERRNADFDKE